MSRFVEFIENFLHDRLGDIDIGMVGRVESFDRESMRADVIPLMKKKSGEDVVEYSVLKGIPVNFLLSGEYYIRPDYLPGDLVHLSFSTHNIEEALRDRKPLESARIFSSENAFVNGGIAKTGWSAPGEFGEEGLLIGHREGGAYMKFENNAIKFVVGENETVIDASGIKTTKDVFGESEDRNISLNLHGHSTPVGPTISKIPEGEG